MAATYKAHIRQWDWDGIKADATRYAHDPEIGEETDDEKLIGRVFIGTVFAIMPSGKYYTPWARSNVTEKEADKDAAYEEALNAVAEEHGMWIESGEGDPCDLFACILVEKNEEKDNDYRIG